MSTFFACGAECGIVASVAGAGRHLNGNTGTISIVSGEPTAGGSAFRFAATGTTIQHRYDFSAINVGVARFYFQAVSSLPSGNCTIFRFQNAAGDSFDVRLTAAGAIISQINATNATIVTGLTPDTWHYIDVVADATSSPGSMQVAVDGTAPVTLSGVALTGTQLTISRFGVISSVTATVDMDHLVWADSAGNFPIGAGYVAAKAPTTSGPHNQTAGDLKDEFGTNITDGDLSFYKLVDYPADTTTYVAQTVIRTTTYAQYVYDFPPDPGQADPIAVEQIVSFQGGASNTQKAQLYDGTTAADAYALLPTEATVRNQTKHWTQTPSGAAWTAGLANSGLSIRWGFSNDVTPNPQLTSTLLEIAFPPRPVVASIPVLLLGGL